MLCTRCNRPLAQHRITWLELNSATGKYADPEVVTTPADDSQGAFPFHLGCARRQLRKDGDPTYCVDAALYVRNGQARVVARVYTNRDDAQFIADCLNRREAL